MLTFLDRCPGLTTVDDFPAVMIDGKLAMQAVYQCRETALCTLQVLAAPCPNSSSTATAAAAASNNNSNNKQRRQQRQPEPDCKSLSASFFADHLRKFCMQVLCARVPLFDYPKMDLNPGFLFLLGQ